ncbi:MAG TPA: class I SAM-dependent methyltransferase, partial [Candidatus Binataceae bacterium]
GGRILEIGCGTGQATMPFAERGYSMLCLEPGAAMSSIARKKLQEFPNVEIKNISFEKWQPEKSAFDLLISATAFHWITSELRYARAAGALKANGTLAIFRNDHPRPFTGFFDRVQDVYRRIVPQWDDPNAAPSADEASRATVEEIDRSGLFGEIDVRRYCWSREYSRIEYIKLLNTYSDNLSLDEVRRKRLFDETGEIIDAEYGGRISRPYLSTLYLARKK